MVAKFKSYFLKVLCGGRKVISASKVYYLVIKDTTLYVICDIDPYLRGLFFSSPTFLPWIVKC